MILIADSGSTKTDWVLINNGITDSFKTMGFNPYFIDTPGIYKELCAKLLPSVDTVGMKEVYFYGAGCSNDHNVKVVENALSRCFPHARLFVGHDMLAAARALLGDEPGFAAIIGTGSNTCLYDGKEVSHNIDSLGYLMGDEGSGSYIGKKIVRDYLRGYLPKELDADFRKKYNNLTQAEVFDALYHKPLPNRYLAGFCMFADQHKSHSYIQKTVRESFHDFFRNLVSGYPEYEKYSFNCIGSVASTFKDILEEVAASFNMKAGKIIHSPIADLVQYHLKAAKSFS
jgi:glucosamine kinase